MGRPVNYESVPSVLIIVLNLISNKIIFVVMVKFHTDQAVRSTGTYHFAGHMQNTACQPTENEKRIQIVASMYYRCRT
jgi:hypothetical protein